MAFNNEDFIEIKPGVGFSDGVPTTHMYGRVAINFKGITLEKLEEIGHPTNAHVADTFLQQSFTDMQYVYLGLYDPG